MDEEREEEFKYRLEQGTSCGPVRIDTHGEPFDDQDELEASSIANFSKKYENSTCGEPMSALCNSTGKPGDISPMPAQ